MKYTSPRLNTAGDSRCWPGHGLATSPFTCV